MKKLRTISLIVLVITSVVSIDLLSNLLGNLIPEINDGLGMHTIFLWGNLYFGDSLWSIERFYNAFIISSMVTLAMFIENIILAIIDINKK